MKELKTDSAAQLKVKETIVVSEEPGEEIVASAVSAESNQTDKVVMVEAPSKSFPEPAPDLGARYHVLDYVGAGGMGTVWKVYDKELKETFAIKVLKPELLSDDVSLKRFQQEARLATDLTHANIAAIFGPGEDTKGRPYIIMRYVEGESLAETLYMEGAFEQERALDIFWQIYAALKHSHMKGIIHRDIKPSNIILSRTESGGDLVHLVDFGISKSLHEEVSKTQALTKAVDVFGSPRYMSPEQFLGKEVGPETDIYSLGCVLYEMLTGNPPFTDQNPIQLAIAHMQETPELENIPVEYHILLSSLLWKDPLGRKRSTEYLEVIQADAPLNLSRQAHPESLSFSAFFLLAIFPFIITSLLIAVTPLPLIAIPIFASNFLTWCIVSAILVDSSLSSKRQLSIKLGCTVALYCSAAVAMVTIIFPHRPTAIALSLVLLSVYTCGMYFDKTNNAIKSSLHKMTEWRRSERYLRLVYLGFLAVIMSTRLFVIFTIGVMSALCIQSQVPFTVMLGILNAGLALLSNYFFGAIEIPLTFEKSRLRRLKFASMSRRTKLTKLASLTITGLIAFAAGSAISPWFLSLFSDSDAFKTTSLKSPSRTKYETPVKTTYPSEANEKNDSSGKSIPPTSPTPQQ